MDVWKYAALIGFPASLMLIGIKRLSTSVLGMLLGFGLAVYYISSEGSGVLPVLAYGACSALLLGKWYVSLPIVSVTFYLFAHAVLAFPPAPTGTPNPYVAPSIAATVEVVGVVIVSLAFSWLERLNRQARSSATVAAPPPAPPLDQK